MRSVMFGGRKTPQVYPICEAWSVPAFAASWPGRLVKESVRTSVWERNIKRKREAEQSCDPKHTDGSTKEWLKKNKDVWKWSRQSSDHSPSHLFGKFLWKKPHNCSHNTVTAAVTDMYNSTFYIHTSYSEQMYTFDMWCCVNFEQMNNLLQ